MADQPDTAATDITAVETTLNAIIEGAAAKVGVPAALVAPLLAEIESKLVASGEAVLTDVGAKLNGPAWTFLEKKEGQEFVFLRPLIDPSLDKAWSAVFGPKPKA